MMTDTRYLITYDDGGSGMRKRQTPLAVGDTVEDCGSQYVIVNIEPPRTEAGFGRAWAERMMSTSDS
jgi:hypothetical protein